MSWYNWIRSQEYDAAVREIKSTHRLKHMDSTLFFRLEDETKHYQTDLNVEAHRQNQERAA